MMYQESKDRNKIHADSSSLFTVEPSDANRPSFATLVTSAIFQAQKHVGSGTPNFAAREEDSDEWLSITESMMENLPSQDLLSSKSDVMDVDNGKEVKEMTSEQQATAQAKQLKGLAEKVGKFIKSKGDVEGATFEE
jgi:hypothetical protein